MDVGCGEGKFLSLLGDRWEKFGTEICEPAAEIARERDVITDFEFQVSYFDLIIFRGTIKAIPDPFHRIGGSYYWLKDGGWLVFLSTPNTNSPVYRQFNDLAVLNPKYDLFVPSDIMLKRILTFFGFDVVAFEYPYLGNPYENLPMDLIKFLLALLRTRRSIDFPFFRYLMECYATKA